MEKERTDDYVRFNKDEAPNRCSAAAQYAVLGLFLVSCTNPSVIGGVETNGGVREGGAGTEGGTATFGPGGQTSGANGGGSQTPGVPDTPGGPTNNGGSATPDIPFAPSSTIMRRLTQEQWRNSIADTFGENLDLSHTLEADNRVERFLSIGASKIGTSDYGVEQYMDASVAVATEVMKRKSQLPPLAGCSPDQNTDPCIENTIRHFGRLLWRRSLSPQEVERYVGVVQSSGDSSEGIELGITYALAGLMASPHFLYISSTGEPDEKSDHRRYTSVEMASRLAHFIWNSAPDKRLIDAAENGDLVDPEGIEREVRRMLTDKRAKDLAYRFFAEAWNVEGLHFVDKDTALFPKWTKSLLQDAKEELRTTLLDLVENDSDMRSIFDGESSFANGDLATFYGVSGAGSHSDFAPVSLPPERRGLVTSAAVIAANSPAYRTSPTIRGVFVTDRLLCIDTPPPPPNVEAELPQEGTAGSVRELLAQHRRDPSCAGCHNVIDPPGLVLEAFDAIGNFSTEEASKLEAVEFQDNNMTTARELAEWLGETSQATECIARNLYEYAVGHEMERSEFSTVQKMHETFKTSGYRFNELVVALTKGDGFRLMAEPE